MNMNKISELVQAKGYTLPTARKPAANYVSTKRIGSLLYVSGCIPTDSAGAPAWIGTVGDSFSDAQGAEAAASCALNILVQLAIATNDDASKLDQLVRLGVFVAATPQFKAHSQVANGASDVLVAVLGERGRHVRTAVGVASLPVGVAVEVDAIIALRD
jgi:enamine deaminase RidA (YjgF/YER057c/UK114 family)